MKYTKCELKDKAEVKEVKEVKALKELKILLHKNEFMIKKRVALGINCKTVKIPHVTLITSSL